MKQQKDKTETGLGLPRYDAYVLNHKERLFAILVGCSAMAGIGYLFYQHWLGVILL